MNTLSMTGWCRVLLVQVMSFKGKYYTSRNKCVSLLLRVGGGVVVEGNLGNLR